MLTDQGTTVSLAVSEAERQDVYRFRYAVYVEEMGKSPPDANHDRRVLMDRFDATASLYVLRDGEGALVGTLRVNHLAALESPQEALRPIALEPLLEQAPLETLAYTSRLMLRADWRGGSSLGLLCNRIFADGLDQGMRFDLCHAHPGLIELYEQLGYRRFCAGITRPGVGYQVPMLLALRDRAHLRRCRSPLMRNPALARVIESEDNAEADGLWLEQQSQRYWGLNHRLVDPDRFWALAGDALRQPGQGLPLLLGLSNEQSRRLLKTGTVLQCEAGDRIVSQGEPRQDLFVVMEGFAEVSREEQGQRLGLAVLKPGDVFGEMGFLGRSQRSADVVAATDMRVLVLTQVFLNKALRTQPEAMARVLRNLALVLAERLSSTTERLFQLSRDV